MNSLYMRLAAQNIKKHRRSYVPYMLTGILTAAVFYILHSLSLNPGLGETTGMMLSFGTGVVSIFAVIFLFYTNSFLMKQRKKELGLYNVLGMNKGHIARVILLETLLTALVMLAGGIGAGMLLDKLMYLLVAKLIGVPAQFGFYISTQSIVQTLVLFGVISILIGLSNILRVWRAKPIELLQGGSVGEREPKTKLIMTVLGVLCLGGGYAISIVASQEVTLAIAAFFFAVVLVILGTYFLFTAGSVAVLKLLRKNKSYYYKTQHFISVSGMLYRMKQNAVGLANICILSTMVLVIISSTCSMWYGAEAMISARYPRDIMASSYGGQTSPVFEAFMNEEAAAIPGGSLEKYRYADMTAQYDPEHALTIAADTPAFAYLASINGFMEVAVLPLEEYNKITGLDAALNENEAIFFPGKGEFSGDTVEVFGKTYKAVKPEKTFKICGFVSAVILDSGILVLPDYDAFLDQGLACMERFENYAQTTYCMELGDMSDEEQMTWFDGFQDRFYDRMADGELACGWSLEPRAYSTRDLMALYGSFLFMGVSLGLVFTMAAVLIIYYKQISEGMDDKNRFSIMCKVGLSQSEVKRSIRSQILTVFFLPLITAGVHVVFAFPIINCILRALMLRQTDIFMLSTGVTFVVFAVFYAIVYALTAKVYYKIVSEK